MSAERLRRFVEKWPPSGGHEDRIYSLWTDKEDAPRELLASDIRAALDRIATLEADRPTIDPLRLERALRRRFGARWNDATYPRLAAEIIAAYATEDT